jgi:hypothetical protein
MSPKKSVRVEVELAVTPRDYVMARLAAARMSAQHAIDAIDDIVGLCVDPGEDPKLTERKELLEAALDHAGATARALECAEEAIEQIDPVECEPWDEDGDEADDEDEDETEPDDADIPRATARARRR